LFYLPCFFKVQTLNFLVFLHYRRSVLIHITVLSTHKVLCKAHLYFGHQPQEVECSCLSLHYLHYQIALSVADHPCSLDLVLHLVVVVEEDSILELGFDCCQEIDLCYKWVVVGHLASPAVLVLEHLAKFASSLLVCDSQMLQEVEASKDRCTVIMALGLVVSKLYGLDILVAGDYRY
jgi:hypothetical protein